MTTLTALHQPSPHGLKALPRGVRIAIIGVALLAGLFQARKGLLELAPGIGAEVAAMSQKASEATGQLLALTKDARRNGAPPRQTDPMVAPLLAAVLDAEVLKTKATLGRADMEALAGWGISAFKAGSVYTLAGTGLTDSAKAPNDLRFIQQVDRNIAAYAPEVGRYYDAMLIIDGALADVVADNFGGAEAADTPKTKEAKAKIQLGVASLIYGVIDSFKIKAVSNDWRRSRLQALDYAIPKAAKLLPADQYGELRELSRATAAATRDAAVKHGLENVAAALKC
jgi:hypothetical protein